MSRTKAVHAHGSEEKAARRSSILEAARELFLAGGGALPTAAEIASAAGLAKGTVYLYFRTKEEIFAALLQEEWGAVMEMTRHLFASGAGTRRARMESFVSGLVSYFGAHPELLRLDALAHSVLERNMPRDAFVAYKADYLARLEVTGFALDAALRLPKGRGVQLLMRTYAMTSGLWQSYEHAEETLQAGAAILDDFRSKPFGEELREALMEYWRGALLHS